MCDDVDNGLDNTCEVIRQETVVFSTPETDYIIYMTRWDGKPAQVFNLY